MNIEERLSQLDIDEDEIVYQLSYADAMCVVKDTIKQEQLDSLTDNQLFELIHAVAHNFGNIDWYEWGQSGYEFHTSENNLFQEENENDLWHRILTECWAKNQSF